VLLITNAKHFTSDQKGYSPQRVLRSMHAYFV